MLVKLYIDNKIVLDTTVKKFELKLEFSDGWIRKIWKGVINKKSKPETSPGPVPKRVKRSLEAANRALDKIKPPVTTTEIPLKEGNALALKFNKNYYPCPLCPAVFKKYNSLKTHLGWHKRWEKKKRGGGMSV